MTHGLQLLRSGTRVAGDTGAETPLKKNYYSQNLSLQK